MSHDFQHEDTLPRRPHHVASSGLGSARVVFVAHLPIPLPPPIPQPSDAAGLSVTIDGNMKVLRRAGVHCETWRINTPDELWTRLEGEEWKSPRPITHVIISTPNFAFPEHFSRMGARWAECEFVMLNHTGLSYLSIDNHGDGVKRTRTLLDMQLATHNIRVAGNNTRYVRMLADSYGSPALYLPNLYDVETFVDLVGHRKDLDPLRVGSFGVGRAWKNQLITAQAALSVARRLGVRMELYVNIDPLGQNKDMAACRQQLLARTHGTVIEKEWTPWSQFRSLVRGMDILLNPSFDETHCCVVADGIAEGVPSVVTAAMEWCPRPWQVVHPFDPAAVSYVAMAMLADRAGTIHDGRAALREHVSSGTHAWINYLTKKN